jgi:hypothetical protein
MYGSGAGSAQIIKVPDPEGPKSFGSYGFSYSSLEKRNVPT